MGVGEGHQLWFRVGEEGKEKGSLERDDESEYQGDIVFEVVWQCRSGI